ncbi:hypothetical protein Tco_1519593, partial [Tanacetum coccineum]
KGKATGQGENRPVWNNVQRLNHQNKFVPKAVLTKTGIFPVNTATSNARKINTARPIVNEIRPRNNFYKSHSPIRKPCNRTTTPKANFTNHKVNTAGDKAVGTVRGIRKTAVKTSAGCNWRPKKLYLNKFSKYNGGSNSIKCVDFKDPLDDPQRALKNKRIVDSGCSRHMTSNKACLVEYQDYNGDPVAFVGSKGQITGKGKDWKDKKKQKRSKKQTRNGKKTKSQEQDKESSQKSQPDQPDTVKDRNKGSQKSNYKSKGQSCQVFKD